MDQPTPITEAIRLFKLGKREESAQLLQDFLRSQSQNVEALLWLARVTPNDREAIAAAELALSLQPENEIAHRAVAAVQSRDSQHAAPDRIDPMRITGMTLSQARAVVWPFNGLCRPIGVLADEGAITPKDLLWAMKNARDTLIQRASRTLLLDLVLGEHVQASPAPLTVIEGADYTGHEERRSLAISGLLAGASGIIILVAVVYLLIFFALFVSGSSPTIGALPYISLLLMILAWGGMKLFDRYSERSDQFKQGREAEEKVIDSLRASLSSPWVLMHNMEWPDRHWGDVDLLLIGPGGIWAIEVKSYSKPIRNMGHRWEYQSRWGWRRMSKDPGRQATNNAIRIKEWLASQSVPVKCVNALVVWAGEDKSTTLEDPAVPVWRLSELSDRVEEFWREQRLNEEQVQICVKVFRDAIDRVKASLVVKGAKDRKAASPKI